MSAEPPVSAPGPSWRVRTAIAVVGGLVSSGLLAAPTAAVAWRWHNYTESWEHYGEWDLPVAMLQTFVVLDGVLVVGALLLLLPRRGGGLRAFGAGVLIAPLVAVVLVVWAAVFGPFLAKTWSG